LLSSTIRTLCFSSCIFSSNGARTTLCNHRPATSTHSYSLRSLGSINLVSKMPQSKDGKSAFMPPVIPLSAGAAVEDGFWHISYRPPTHVSEVERHTCLGHQDVCWSFHHTAPSRPPNPVSAFPFANSWQASRFSTATSGIFQPALTVPMYHMVELHHYDGKGHPLGWLIRCEQFYHEQHMHGGGGQSLVRMLPPHQCCSWLVLCSRA